MFGRPRCREWTPLATQQLRLRSLIQIVGYNIRPPEGCTAQCSFYLTLHHTTMSAPFYTSERISSPHPKWKEIDSEITQRISSTNVVIRIWCHVIRGAGDNTELRDTVIQTWGVYFSGLRYIGANLASNFTSDCFKSNTLVFQMHGGYFCSYKSLKLDIIPPENEQDIKECSSVLQNQQREYSKSHSPNERGYKSSSPAVKSSKSMSIHASERERDEKESSDQKKSDPNYIYEHSPDNLDVTVFDNSVVASPSTSIEELTDTRIDLSETAENYDLRNESDRVPKYRYLALHFLKSELRQSYTAAKLQQLHLLQYSIKKRQEAMQEIKERIYQKSALTCDWAEETYHYDLKTKSKNRSLRNLFSTEEENVEGKSSQTDMTKNSRIKANGPPVSHGPRLTLKLNDLLSFKAKPSPFQRAEHVRLTKQLEILRFKRILLADERDSKLANIRRLKEIHAKLLDENQEIGLELMQDYHALSRRREVLKETRQSCGAIRELATRSYAELITRRSELLKQLHQIFYITQENQSMWKIIDVPLPICGDESPRVLKPVADSVAAGFVAQATCLTAAIINQPLRYKLSLLGSASKITDITANLPDPDIPLFARGGDMTLFRYAMFLLNKTIAQLLWGCGLHVNDMRPTLANLQRLMTTPCNITDSSKLLNTYRWLSENHQCPRTQSLRSLVASERGKQHRQFNRFKDCVEGQSPTSVMNLRRHRPSRSVGSYHDDQELSLMDQSTASIMGSEPNIYVYNTKLTEASLSDMPLMFKRNSDSQLSRISTDQNYGEDVADNKVVFTLGDATEINVNQSTEGTDGIGIEMLVKLSSNNGDETPNLCVEHVTQVCTEIKDFCDKNNDIHEGFDIAKHIETNERINISKYMERQVSCELEIEEADACRSCDSNKDGVCDLACANKVSDVIVIPSSEAILNTALEMEASHVSEQIHEIKCYSEQEPGQMRALGEALLEEPDHKGEVTASDQPRQDAVSEIEIVKESDRLDRLTQNDH